jgi:putative oxidoreductase
MPSRVEVTEHRNLILVPQHKGEERSEDLKEDTEMIGEFVYRLMQTEGDILPTILRLALGIVIFPHGAQKLLGWFGGDGYRATMDSFTKGMGIPALFAILPIIVEFFGSLALILGLVTRLVALGIAVDMLVAVWTVHRHNGFFMNWEGEKEGEGFEFHILVVAIAVALVIGGGGALSLDLALSGSLF